MRAGCLERYREKKRRRLHSNIIRYEKRKVNADNRHATAPKCFEYAAPVPATLVRLLTWPAYANCMMFAPSPWHPEPEF